MLRAPGEAVTISAKRSRMSGFICRTKTRVGDTNGVEELNVAGWSKDNPGLIGGQIPQFEKPELSYADKTKLEGCSTAYDFYKIFNPDSFAKTVIYQSILYAEQTQKQRHQEYITENVLRCTEAFLLHSGYHQLPRRKMIWEMKPDCRNEFIASHITRDQVDAMLASLHFRDNQLIDKDGFYKVRPIFDNLNEGGRFFADQEKFSVDEIMIPYYGRHSAKQYIHGKPVRYGFKVWSLCSSDGAGLTFEPYCGSDTKIVDEKMGQGPNVVLDLVSKSRISRGSSVYFDNLFTSFPLLDRLSEMEIAGTGTVRQNR